MSADIICSSQAYVGNLVASLTKPARTKAINTFGDILDLPNEASVFMSTGQWGVYLSLKETSDPILKVCTMIMQYWDYIQCEGKVNMIQAVFKKAQSIKHDDIPKEYHGYDKLTRWVYWILGSPSQVVHITYIDYVELTLGTAFARQSGKKAKFQGENR